MKINSNKQIYFGSTWISGNDVRRLKRLGQFIDKPKYSLSEFLEEYVGMGDKKQNEDFLEIKNRIKKNGDNYDPEADVILSDVESKELLDRQQCMESLDPDEIEKSKIIPRMLEMASSKDVFDNTSLILSEKYLEDCKKANPNVKLELKRFCGEL